MWPSMSECEWLAVSYTGLREFECDLMASAAPDNAALLERLRRGDPEALAEAVREHARPLLRAAKAMGFREEEAEDIPEELIERCRSRPWMSSFQYRELLTNGQVFTKKPTTSTEEPDKCAYPESEQGCITNRKVEGTGLPERSARPEVIHARRVRQSYPSKRFAFIDCPSLFRRTQEPQASPELASRPRRNPVGLGQNVAPTSHR